jgi:hypothetical protein
MSYVFAFIVASVVSYTITTKLFQTDSAIAHLFNFVVAFSIAYLLA